MDNLVNAIKRMFFGQHPTGVREIPADNQDQALDAETVKNLVQLLEKQKKANTPAKRPSTCLTNMST